MVTGPPFRSGPGIAIPLQQAERSPVPRAQRPKEGLSLRAGWVILITLKPEGLTKWTRLTAGRPESGFCASGLAPK